MGLKKRSQVTAEFSMSSLTDIIFLLLIFFMLTSTLVSPNALNLKLPSSSSQTTAPSSIRVSIDQDGTFYFNEKRSSPTLIKSQLRDAAGDDPQNTTVTIVAERTVPIEDVVKVMDIAMQLKLNAILATEVE